MIRSFALTVIALLCFAGTKLYAGAVSVTLATPNNPAVAAATVCPGATNVLIYYFTLARGGGQGPTVTDFQFKTAGGGTYVAADITNFKLWYSGTTANSLGTATLLSTFTPVATGPGSTYLFPAFSQTLPNNNTYYFYVTMDVALGAIPPHTLTVSATVAADVTSSGGSTGSGNAGGTQTIGAGPAAFAVTGGGTYCTGGVCPNIGLAGSTLGVNYQLYNGVLPVGGTVPGTGGAITFGPQCAGGTYTVTGIPGAGCQGQMTGSVTVTANPAPTLTVGTTPEVCQGTTSACIPYSAVVNSPDRYDITWNAPAPANGFANVVNAANAFGGPCLTIAVPAGAAANTYTGTLRIRVNATGCYTDYPISVIVSAAVATCPTLSSPANGASGVSAGSGTTLTWTAVAGATSYDVYFGTGSCGAAVLVANVLAPTVTYATGSLLGFTNYYWYVIPRNICGPRAACSATCFSFTTGAASVCVTHTTLADFNSGDLNNTDASTTVNSVQLATIPTTTVNATQLASSGTGYTITNTQYIAQTFTPTITGKLTMVELGFFSNTNPGTCTVEIFNTSGGKPTTAIAGTATTFTFFGGDGLYPCTITTPPCLTSGIMYAIVCRKPLTGIAGNWDYNSNTYAAGTTCYSLDAGVTWTIDTRDQVFRTYMTTYAYSTSGDWTSPLISSAGSSDWKTLSWNATVPGGTTLKFQLATSNSNLGPFIFVGPDCTSATFYTTTPGNNILDANNPAAPWSCTYGKRYAKYKAYFTTTTPNGTGCAPGVTPTLADATICYDVLTCTAPTVKATNIVFSAITSAGMTLNWTNGNGNKRIVKIRRSIDPAFTEPIDGTDPVANTVYSGAGEQVIYNSSGNAVTVTGLLASTTYCFEVWEGNCTGVSVKWLTPGASTNNPLCQATAACTPPTVTAYSNPTELCLPGSVQLNASGATSYTWTVTSGPATLTPVSGIGNPITANLTASSCFQVSGCVGAGGTCCSSLASPLCVTVTPPQNLYPGPIGDMTKFQGFEPTSNAVHPIFSCTSNATNTGVWLAGTYQTTAPSGNGNWWLLRTKSLNAAAQCMFAWGQTGFGYDVNKFGNDVLIDNWSLTCEGTDAAMGGHIYYGFYAGVNQNKRVVLTPNVTTGFGAYGVTFTYQIGCDTLQNYWGSLDYSTDGGTTWFIAQKFQKVWTATGQTVTVNLPSTVRNIANGQLKIGFSLNIPGTNLDYSPTFTVDNVQVFAYALPVDPTAPTPVGPTTVCPDADFTQFTSSPGSFSYLWTITPGTGTLNGTTIIGSGNTATVYWSGTQTPGTYNVCVQAQSQCGATSAPICTVVTVAAGYSWTNGGGDRWWHNPLNWACGQVPDNPLFDVTIPGGVNGPIIDNGEAYSVRDIIISAGGAPTASLTINGIGQLSVYRNITAIASSITNNGIIELSGSAAQTIPAGVFVGNNSYGITISNTSGSVPAVTLAGTLNITGVLAMTTAKTFSTSTFLTLKSSATATAQVSAIPAGGNITGTVTAERYYPAKRAWRLVSIPVVSAQTVKAAFMEGVYNTAISPWPASNNDPFPGFGLHISGASEAANQFDVTTNHNPSMLTYGGGSPVLGTDTWTGIANTGININTATGYMLFVRGNRSTNLPLNTAAPTSNTVLRPKGTLRIGDQVFPAPAGSFTIVGNPYASSFDFRQVIRTGGVIDAFSVLDPYQNGPSGTGGNFVTYTWNGSSYSNAPPASGPGLGQNIQSGQAILIQNTGAVGNITIKEAHKQAGSVLGPFTPQMNIEQFRTNIYRFNPDGTTSLADGVLAIFGGINYSAGEDQVDALKPLNMYETVSHNRDGRALAIEARPLISNYDVLHYNISLYNRPYRFEFIADGLDHPGLRGYLHDNYLNTDSPLDMNGTTTVDFTISSDVASQSNDRFSVIFTTDAPLPVTLKTIKAYEKNAGVQVDWTLNQEINMDRYEVERSTTGNNFSKSGSVASAGNSNGASYGWFDAAPNTGANFYRVKMIDKNGQSSYSSIVKVVISRGVPSITVYPNPAVDGVINIQFSNVPKGVYDVKLINSVGQVVMIKQVKHDGGSSNETMRPDKQIAHGNYQLEITGGDNAKMTTKVIY